MVENGHIHLLEEMWVVTTFLDIVISGDTY